jgi:hypothetical protein
MGRKTNPFDDTDHFTPNMIRRDLMPQLGVGCHNQVKAAAKDLIERGWRMYVVAQTRGRCYYNDKVITIPAWVIEKRDVEYKDWYISHECAHAYRCEANDRSANHGDRFMQELIRICPNVSLKYEIEYKPRNATRNGITQNGIDPMSEFGF